MLKAGPHAVRRMILNNDLDERAEDLHIVRAPSARQAAIRAFRESFADVASRKPLRRIAATFFQTRGIA